MPLDDGLAHAQDGVKALLDVLHEPARLLQPRRHRPPALAANGRGVEVVDAQARHHVRVEQHLEVAPAALHHHVGHDDLRLRVGKGPAGLGLAGQDQRLGLTQQGLVSAGGGHQPLHVAPRQQVQVLGAQRQRQIAGRGDRACAQLDRQAFGQRARAHAGRVQALQPVQGTAQPAAQVIGIVFVEPAGQGFGNVFQAVGEVAILVEGFDQHHQGGGVPGRQPQARDLAAQVVGQADVEGAPLLRIHLVVAGGAGRARRGGQLADAVEVIGLGAVGPVLPLRAAELCSVELSAGVLALGTHLARRIALGLLLPLAGAVGGRGALQGRLPHGAGVVLGLQEGVLFEHLLDFLVQLQRGQLQQADGLLQLRRERQVLGKANLQGGAHAYIRKCSPR